MPREESDDEVYRPERSRPAGEGAALTAEVDDFGGFACDGVATGTHHLEVPLGG